MRSEAAAARPTAQVNGLTEPDNGLAPDRSGIGSAPSSGFRGAAILFVLVSTCRAVYSWHHDGIYRVPDELSYLGGARWFAGGNWNMLTSVTWYPGYSVLLRPIFWLTDDPDRAIRLTLLLNAVLGGAAAVLLYVLGRRITGAPDGRLLVTAGVVSLLPAGLAGGAHAWPESAITVVVLAAEFAMIRLVESGRVLDASAVVVATAVGYSMHGRTGPLAIAAAAALVVAAARHGRPAAMIGIGASLLAALALLHVCIGQYHDSVWESTLETNTIGATLRRLGDVGGLALSAVGQVWYVAVSTLGLAVIGAWRLSAEIRRRERREPAAIVLGTTLLLVLLSILFMTGRDQPHYTVYGRYNDAVLGPLVLVGAVWALSRPPQRFATRVAAAIIGLVLATAAVLEVSGRFQPPRRLVTWDMTPGLVPFALGRNHIDVALITLVAILIGIALVALVLSSEDRVVAAVMVAVMIAFGVASRTTVHTRPFTWYITGDERNAAELAVGGEDVAVRFASTDVPDLNSRVAQLASALTISWYLPDSEFGQSIESRLVLSPVDDPIARERGDELLIVFPQFGMAIWRSPP